MAASIDSFDCFSFSVPSEGVTTGIVSAGGEVSVDFSISWGASEVSEEDGVSVISEVGSNGSVLELFRLGIVIYFKMYFQEMLDNRERDLSGTPIQGLAGMVEVPN